MPYAANPPPRPLERSLIVEMESIMRLPEKRLPDFEKIPDIAHPDRFLNIPSLTIHTPS